MIEYGFIKEIDAAGNFEKVEDYLKHKFGVSSIFSLKQVHDDRILVNESGEADGIIVTKKGCAGVVRTADCFPVVLFDRKKDVAGVFHCGWRGTELGIHEKGFGKMLEMGCQDIEAIIFPGIGKCCFEIGFELEERFKKAEIPLMIRDGKLYADILKKLENDLDRLGAVSITSKAVCTYCSDGYFSYRKDGTKKRHATFIAKFS